jgi:hypothetical protein
MAGDIRLPPTTVIRNILLFENKFSGNQTKLLQRKGSSYVENIR